MRIKFLEVCAFLGILYLYEHGFTNNRNTTSIFHSQASLAVAGVAGGEQGWDMLPCSNNGQGQSEGHADPQPLHQDETSRGQGIGENLGVKGVREIGIKFRIFILSRSYRKLPRCFLLLLCSLFAHRPDTLHQKCSFLLAQDIAPYRLQGNTRIPRYSSCLEINIHMEDQFN